MIPGWLNSWMWKHQRNHIYGGTKYIVPLSLSLSLFHTHTLSYASFLHTFALNYSSWNLVFVGLFPRWEVMEFYASVLQL